MESLRQSVESLRESQESFKQSSVVVAISFVAFIAYVGRKNDLRSNAMETKMDQRFDKMDQRFDKMDQRLDKMDQRLDKMDQKMNIMFMITTVIAGIALFKP